MNSKRSLNSLRLLAALFTVAAAAYGQQYNGHGYGFFSMDSPNGGTLLKMMSAGAGGEGFLYKGLALGGELSYVFPREYPSDGFGLFSVNGAYHFVNRQRPGRIVPFVTGGYTLGFRSGTANLMNWGGGVTWWVSQRVGLRTEVRSYEYVGSHAEHFLAGVRFGVQFR